MGKTTTVAPRRNDLGPNAVNGVVSIVTKDTSDTHGALVSVGGGNEDQGFINFRYGGGNSKDYN